MRQLGEAGKRRSVQHVPVPEVDRWKLVRCKLTGLFIKQFFLDKIVKYKLENVFEYSVGKRH